MKEDNKVKSWKNYNTHVATPFIKTPNGFNKAKAHALRNRLSAKQEE